MKNGILFRFFSVRYDTLCVECGCQWQFQELPAR